VQIAPKNRGFDLDIQKIPKMSEEPVYEVERRIVIPLSKRRIAIDLLNIRIARIETPKVGIIAP
jgi:hypothetical protein